MDQILETYGKKHFGAPTEQNIENLRSLTKDCINKNSLRTAEFFGDKLVTLTGGNEDDVYNLGLIHHRLGQNHRMIHLFQKHHFLSDPKEEVVLGQASTERVLHPRFLLLSMEGLYQTKAYEDSLKLTDYIDDHEAYRLIKLCCFKDSEKQQRKQNYTFDYISALCLLRGKCWEALEHQEYAVRWYERALEHDVKNFEAFSRLTERRMIDHKAEKELLAGLENLIRRQGGLNDIGWLFSVYEATIQQFDYGIHEVDQVSSTHQRFKKWNLQDNEHILALKAHTHYNLNAYEQCHQITSKIIQKSPFNEVILAPHICSLVEIGAKADLHYLAHQLANKYPEKPISWFAVGAYYYLVGKFDVARRHFNKSTDLDQHFAPSWIGFGHSFGYQDASDQAVAAYRTAHRLFPGSHIPLVCIGMEYVRTQNLPLALRFFNQARTICPLDPLIYNELGIIAYKNNNFSEAVHQLEEALKYCSSLSAGTREPVLYNLGHAYRKLRNYKKAITVYKEALELDPQNPKLLTAIAFTHLLREEYDEAIAFCHKSLSLLPTDSFTDDILKHAVKDVYIRDHSVRREF